MYIPPKRLNKLSSQEKKKLERLSRELLNCNLFQLKTNAKYAPAEVMKLFVDAAIANRSAESRSKTCKGISADDALLHIKDKTTVESIESMAKQFISRRFIKLLHRKYSTLKITIALDFTPEAFYGDKSCPYVTGYEPKDGTYYCFKFLTVCLVINGMRYFLFAYPAYRSDNRIWLVNRALEFLEELQLKPDLLLMDREFYETDIFALLREKRIYYEMPAKHDSHFERALKDCKKLPAVVHDYEITNAQHESEWVDLVIIEDNEHEKNMIYGYVTNLPTSEYRNDVLILRDNYKKRWGIETAHRVHDQFRIKTCCKEGNVRYFFFIIAVLLYNFWVYVNLLMNDCKVEEIFEIRITVDEMKDQIIEFFRNNPVLPVRIAM